MGGDVQADLEERGVGVVLAQQLEHLGRPTRVGPVVEGEGDMVGGPQAGQTWEVPAPEAGARRDERHGVGGKGGGRSGRHRPAGSHQIWDRGAVASPEVARLCCTL